MATRCGPGPGLVLVHLSGWELGFGLAPFFGIGASFHCESCFKLIRCNVNVMLMYRYSYQFLCYSHSNTDGIIGDPATSKRFVNELGNRCRYKRAIPILILVLAGHPVVWLMQKVLSREGFIQAWTENDVEPSFKGAVEMMIYLSSCVYVIHRFM